MKKTVWTLIVGIVASFACACGLSSCSKGGTKGLVFEQHPVRSDEMVVVGFEGNSQMIIIPNEYEGKPVTCIADGVFENTGIISVTLPTSLSELGDNVFAGCKRLETVKHKNCFLTIGDNAFYGCEKLLTIEHTSNAFYPESIGAKAFYGCESLTEVPFEGGGWFDGIYIGDEAFANCTALSKVSLPSNINYLGKGAFANCNQIPYNVKGGLKYLGNEDNPYVCLMGAESGITTATFEADCTYVAPLALTGCTSLTEVVFPKMNTYLGYYFGAKSAVENPLYVPTSLRKVTVSGNVPSQAFYGCENITEINLSSCWNIGYGAFENCRGLTRMHLKESMDSVGGSIWKGCTSLTEVSVPFLGGTYNASSAKFSHVFGGVVPSSLKKVTVFSGEIKDSAFENCSAITHVTLGENVYKIKKNAFKNCNALQEIQISQKVTNIENNSFDGCYSLKNINVDSANTKYKTVDGSLYTKNGAGLAKYAVGKTDSSFTVPESVTGIWAGAFAGNTTLQTIVLPNQISKINDGTFLGCTALQNITIPDGVTYIGANAFRYCRNLKNVTIGSQVEEIGSYAFDACDSLVCNTYENVKYLASKDNAYFSALGIANANAFVTRLHENTKMVAGSAFAGCLNLQTLDIGSGVTTIGGYAFQNCQNLQEIIIPDNVTEMGIGVFSGCTGLTSAQVNASIETLPEKTFEGCTSLTDVDIDGMQGLGRYAFDGCIALTEFIMPNSITSMGIGAFDGCTGLTKIVFSENLTNVSAWAFMDCTSLTSVVIPASVSSFGNYAFQGCSNLVEVYILSTEVSYMGDYVFERCGDLTIYCSLLESATDHWYPTWNSKEQYSYGSYDVEWGYTGGV